MVCRSMHTYHRLRLMIFKHNDIDYDCRSMECELRTSSTEDEERHVPKYCRVDEKNRWCVDIRTHLIA